MSRQNHNVNYLYDTDGETVWEKLRVIRTMLEGRRLARDLAILTDEEKKETLIEDSFEHKKYLLYKPQNDTLLRECCDEIKFLEEFESWLANEAEKTRIAGKTDDEMYEINFYEEIKIRLVKRAQAQYIATGRVEADTLQRIIKNKSALQLAISTGILNKDALPFMDQIPCIEREFGHLEWKP